MAKFTVVVEIEISEDELENLDGGLIRQIDKLLEDDRFYATTVLDSLIDVDARQRAFEM